MPAYASELPLEVARLLEQKKFQELEDLWTRRMEEAPRDLPFFFALGQAAKKKGAPAIQWMRFLADYEKERGDADSRIAVLLEAVRMAPSDAEIRADLEEALKSRFAGHSALRAVMARFPVVTAADPSEAAGRVRRWLTYVPGEIVAMTGRGAGRIIEMNPALDVIRVEFGSARLPFSLVSAEKNLSKLPPRHFLRTKVEDLPSLRTLAAETPAEAVQFLLESFGRTLTVAEVKEHMEGVVEEARWTAFWGAARKNRQLLVTGTGKSAFVSWVASAGVAEDAVRNEFNRADPGRKIDLARQHAKRSKSLGEEFASGLASEAERHAESRPGLAWELSQAASRLRPGEPDAFPAARLLESHDLPRVLSEIRDPGAREKALEAVHESRADAFEILAEQFYREEDGRVLASLDRWLAEKPERRADIVRRILRSPRTAPRAFLWFCERAREEKTPLPSTVFPALLDALRQEEFSGFRSRVKELFEPGNLAVTLVRGVSSEDEARDYLHALNRAGGLEEHRRTTVREALLMAFPSLRAPARERLYSTPEAIEGRREELTRLRQVDLPANAEAMRAAREHGDLSENFEYHAARQRHEYISARIAALAEDLSRATPLDASRVDASEVRVGTRVTLRTGTEERTVTILGPWDSRPAEAVYSYESEFAERLLGAKPGDRVSLPEGEAEIVAITPWR